MWQAALKLPSILVNVEALRHALHMVTKEQRISNNIRCILAMVAHNYITLSLHQSVLNPEYIIDSESFIGTR